MGTRQGHTREEEGESLQGRKGGLLAVRRQALGERLHPVRQGPVPPPCSHKAKERAGKQAKNEMPALFVGFEGLGC